MSLSENWTRGKKVLSFLKRYPWVLGLVALADMFFLSGLASSSFVVVKLVGLVNVALCLFALTYVITSLGLTYAHQSWKNRSQRPQSMVMGISSVLVGTMMLTMASDKFAQIMHTLSLWRTTHLIPGAIALPLQLIGGVCAITMLVVFIRMNFNEIQAGSNRLGEHADGARTAFQLLGRLRGQDPSRRPSTLDAEFGLTGIVAGDDDDDSDDAASLPPPPTPVMPAAHADGQRQPRPWYRAVASVLTLGHSS